MLRLTGQPEITSLKGVGQSPDSDVPSGQGFQDEQAIRMIGLDGLAQAGVDVADLSLLDAKKSHSRLVDSVTPPSC